MISNLNDKMTIKKAVSINAASRYLNILLNVLVGAILARLISPEDHGIIAIIVVFTTFFSTLSDMGLGTSIIQNKELKKDEINSIFTFSVYVSIALAIAFWFISYGIASFYERNVLIIVGHYLSFALLLGSLNTVPNGILSREKMFLSMAIRNVSVSLVSAIVAIALAFLGVGIYALIVQSILSAFLTFTWSLWLTDVTFTWVFSKSSIKKIANYSGYQYAFSIMNYFARNLDNLLVGKYVGTTQLAFYNKAYNLMLYPVNNITGVITPVLHPILSDYQKDKNYIYDQYIKILHFISILSVFIQVYCFYTGEHIIRFVYGSKWDGAIICFRFLSLAVMTQMLTGTTGSIFQSLGKTRLLFYSAMINILITISSIILGIIIGESAEFVALCVSLSYVCHFFISFFAMMKWGFEKSYISFLYELKNVFAMMAIMFLAGAYTPFGNKSDILCIIFNFGYFGLIYIICLWVFDELKYLKYLRIK